MSRYDGEPLTEVNPKKKILEKLKPDMKTDASKASREPLQDLCFDNLYYVAYTLILRMQRPACQMYPCLPLCDDNQTLILQHII